VVLNRVRPDTCKKMADMKVSHTATVEISAANVDDIKAVLEADGALADSRLAVVARETILDDKLMERAA